MKSLIKKLETLLEAGGTKKGHRSVLSQLLWV